MRIERSELSASAVSKFRLLVVEGPDKGLSLEVSERRCTIGVHESCDLRLQDSTVSRFHCEVSSEERVVRIRDIESKNGTLVNGVRIMSAFLKRASLIRIGRTSLRFELLDQSHHQPVSRRTRFGLMVGHTFAMRRVFAVLERTARSSATILLSGETGTGKTVAARSIHQESARADGPFVMLDCSALPPNLLESELFGHEKGAFTGAFARRIGAFEEAHGGTIFLDEMGELPLELQAKLLSVLENREVRRVGSNRSIPVDVRIVVASNRDLRAEVNCGRFREDLYYRLAVVDIEIPPLRQRLVDIPLIVDRLLEGMDAPAEAIAAVRKPAFLKQLRGSAWPGNIRELRNHLERHLLLHEPWLQTSGDETDGSIDANTKSVQTASTGTECPAPSPLSIQIEATLPFSEARSRVIAQFERAYVTSLLRAHNGKVADAAQQAGVTRTYLYRVIQRSKRVPA